jgi:hypothetical protein
MKRSVPRSSSGRLITAFDMVRVLALGADWCNSAQHCHTDRGASGVATQNPLRQRALVVPDKAERVRRFHSNTLAALGELVGAAGLRHPCELRQELVLRRISATEVRSFAELYPRLLPGELLSGAGDPYYATNWNVADPGSFMPSAQTRIAA